MVPNQEIQIDFAGPINNEKDHEIYILHVLIDFPNTILLKFLITQMLLI